MKNLVVGLFCLFVCPANASTIFSISQVVTSTDRSATFDSLTSDGIDLSNYTEDSLFIIVNNRGAFQDPTFTPFAPNDFRTTAFHFAGGGSFDYLSISGTDSAVFTGFDFLLGNGEPGDFTNVRWETYLNGALISSGLESGLIKGQVVGWADANGFDELRVAASIAQALPGFGNRQGIAIDDVRAELLVSQVPAPAAVWLFGSSLIVLFGKRRFSTEPAG